MEEWYTLRKDEVLKRLSTTESGLSEEEAARRLIKFGPNKLKEVKKKTIFTLFAEQFKSFLIVILIFATIASILVGDYTEGLVILAIVIISASLGVLQNYRAEKAMAELKKMAPEYSRVLRDGREKNILTEDLVPGDILLFAAGDKVPADCYILEEILLKTDEGTLTGESIPIEKEAIPLPSGTPLGERKNILFAGTSVVCGKGKGVIYATGMNTEFGKIAASLEAIPEAKTPLQVSIDKLGKWLGILTITICAIIGTIGILRGEEILKMFIWAVALAVAVVPEALPAVITICLALGIRRMAKRNALVRRLASVETLGATNVICSDKTGTLTKGEMSVEEVFLEEGRREIAVTGVGYEPKGDFILKKGGEGFTEDLKLLLLVGLLCNDSHLRKEGKRWVIDGDPTEGALLVLAAKGGILKEEISQRYPRLTEIPFSPERKMMTTIHRPLDSSTLFVAAKGAGEVILSKCRLEEKERTELLERLRDMSQRGLRVLGIAYRVIEEESPFRQSGLEAYEEELTFLGFVGMIDLPRPEVKLAVEECRRAGIKPIMITGDHILTAKAVAQEIGILREGTVISGEDLDKMDAAELTRRMEDIEVIARVSPFHKLRIVEAFQNKGYVVAMTGDGVNDAQALKKADIGVAMGITGTSVSKEVSDLIILDDNFATIVKAIEEGRNIFKNTKNFIAYGLGLHLGEILIMTSCLVFGLPLPLTAAQILWLNLVTDGLPPLALGVEPSEPGLMTYPPRGKKESFFTPRIVSRSGLIGALFLIQALIIFIPNFAPSLPRGQTLVFSLLTISAMFNVFNWRSERISVFRLNPFHNSLLLLAVTSTILLLLAVIYLPFLQKLFGTVPLSASDWFRLLLLSSTTLIFVELIKLFTTLHRRR